MLVYLTERKIGDLFQAARNLPADKLDWSPAPGARSALDQLQEVATALAMHWDLYQTRKLEWSEDKMREWQEMRRQIRDLDALEARCREETARLLEFIENFPEDQLEALVDLPFPGEWKMADIFYYHLWNMGYHEGQINYIGSLLAAESSS